MTSERLNPDGYPKSKVVSTGSAEIDKKLGGGIPLGSMTLIEGESDSGKSVLSQQMIWGSLHDGFNVVLYTTENTIKSFVSQMSSLSLEISDFLLLGRLKIFTIMASTMKMTPHQVFPMPLDHLKRPIVLVWCEVRHRATPGAGERIRVKPCCVHDNERHVLERERAPG